MPNTHLPYSPGYRRRIVKMVRSGRSPKDLAVRFAPSAQTIRKWVDRELEHELRVAALVRFKRALKRPRSFPAGGWLGSLLDTERNYKVKDVVTILRDWGMNTDPKEDPFGFYISSGFGFLMHPLGKPREGRVNDTLSQLNLVRSILEHESVDVIETLLRANDFPSKRALRRLLRFGRLNEHHNYMAIVWNHPLRRLRGLIARHPRYQVEFRERSTPPIGFCRFDIAR